MAELRKPTIVPTQPLRQVVFVHGLNGDKHSTWTVPKGWKIFSRDVFWPEWLAEDVLGTAVWSVGYPASPSYRFSGDAMALPERAANVLPTLISALGSTTGDIVFVGYSLGGLVTQAVLRRAETLAPQNADIAAFLRRVRGIVLLGTPNRGSLHASIATAFPKLTKPRQTLEDLNRNNVYLEDRKRSFVPLVRLVM